MRLNPPTSPFVEFILSEVEGLRVTWAYLLLVQSPLWARVKAMGSQESFRYGSKSSLTSVSIFASTKKDSKSAARGQTRAA